LHVPSTRISEWLPQIAHFNIFVLAHKNANEPAGVLPLWQNSSSTCVKCYGRCNTAFKVDAGSNGKPAEFSQLVLSRPVTPATSRHVADYASHVVLPSLAVPKHPERHSLKKHCMNLTYFLILIRVHC
jgi:hypothetical protein